MGKSMDNFWMDQQSWGRKDLSVRARGQRGRCLRIYLLLAGLAVVLLPGIVLASDHKPYPDHLALYGSTPLNLQPNIIIVVENFRERESHMTGGTSYDPEITYPGVYEANRLYRMSADSNPWVGSYKPAFLKEVTCSEARKRLSQDGSWTGLLKKDGSCGLSSEQSDWALGNRLNYEADIGTAAEPETP